MASLGGKGPTASWAWATIRRPTAHPHPTEEDCRVRCRSSSEPRLQRPLDVPSAWCTGTQETERPLGKGWGQGTGHGTSGPSSWEHASSSGTRSRVQSRLQAACPGAGSRLCPWPPRWSSQPSRAWKAASPGCCVLQLPWSSEGRPLGRHAGPAGLHASIHAWLLVCKLCHSASSAEARQAQAAVSLPLPSHPQPRPGHTPRASPPTTLRAHAAVTHGTLLSAAPSGGPLALVRTLLPACPHSGSPSPSSCCPPRDTGLSAPSAWATWFPGG